MSISNSETDMKVGDWVEVVHYNRDFNGTIGWIEEVDEEKKKFQFKAWRHPKRGPIAGSRVFHEHQLSPMGSMLTEQDLDRLIDWSLDTGNEGAFHSFVEMKTNC